AGDSKGFWIHTDKTEQKDASMAVLIYLNKNWREEDGNILQLWTQIDHDEKIDTVEYSWQEYGDKRLEFLNERYMLTTDLVTSKGLKPAKLFLIDQVTPEYNRLVLADFIRDPGYHSITPGNGRERFAIVQWLF
ncbi:MAG: 2OG-Fe(II) oxygenase, partial [Gammaproteobacteria bacterium]|nr:2OG-Fe(II) oxygenase [Gammaproteobacteria bacterium]